MAKTGPVLRPYDPNVLYAQNSSDLLDLTFRKHKKYFWFPVYDEKSGSLIVYPGDFAAFVNSFISSYPQIYDVLEQLWGGSASTLPLGFLSSGKMGLPGELLISSTKISFRFESPWVIQSGTSFSNVVFDEELWTDDGQPNIPDFTATISDVTGSSVTVTIGTDNFTSEPNGSFLYNKYFTITLSGTPSVSDSIDVTVYPSTSSFSGYTNPAYTVYGSGLQSVSPTYYSGPTNFTVKPGYNVVGLDTAGIMFSVDGTPNYFPPSYMRVTIGSRNYYFYPQRSGCSHFTELLLRIFGDPSSYPMIAQDSGRYGQFAWMDQSEIDKYVTKKFKDCFQTQYTKKYIDMSFSDVAQNTSLGNPRAMSIQFPKYDSDGRLLNNPVFDANGVQVGGASLTKFQPWYDASFLSTRKTFGLIVDDEIKQIDLTLSLASGQIQYRDNGQKISVIPDKSIYDPKENNSNKFFGEKILTIYGVKNGRLYALCAQPGSDTPCEYPVEWFELIGVAPSGISMSLQYYYMNDAYRGSGQYLTPITDIVDCIQTGFYLGSPGSFFGSLPYVGLYLRDSGIFIDDIDSVSNYNNLGSSATQITLSGGSFSYTNGTVQSLFSNKAYYKQTYRIAQKNVCSVVSPVCFVYAGSSWYGPFMVFDDDKVKSYVLERESRTYNDHNGDPIDATYFPKTLRSDTVVTLPTELQSANAIRVFNQSNGVFDDNCPVAVYSDKVVFFNGFYNFKSVVLDNNGNIVIHPVHSIHLSNIYADFPAINSDQYFACPYKVLDARKLLSKEAVHDTDNVLAVGICDGFDVDSNSILYRAVCEVGKDVRLDKIDYANQSVQTASILNNFKTASVNSVSGTSIYLRSGGYFNDGQLWWDNNKLSDWFNSRQSVDFVDSVCYFYRSGSFVQYNGEYAGFRITAQSMYEFTSGNIRLSISPLGSYSLSDVYQSGDQLVFFKNSQMVPSLSNAIAIQPIVRSISHDGSNIYVLYQYITEGDVRFAKIDESKLFGSDPNYIIKDEDITGNISDTNFWGYGAVSTPSRSRHDLIYDSTNSCLWVSTDDIIGNSNEGVLYKIDTTSFTMTQVDVMDSSDEYYDGAGLSGAASSEFYPVPESGYVSYGLRRYDTSGNFTDRNTDYAIFRFGRDNANYRFMLLGFMGANTSLYLEKEEISGSNIIDIVNSDIETFPGFYFYITTQKTGSPIYNYYKVYVPPVQSGYNARPRIEFVKFAETDSDWPEGSDYPYSKSISGNVVTLYSAYNGDSNYISPTLTVDLSFMEDPIQSVSSLSDLSTFSNGGGYTLMEDFDFTNYSNITGNYYANIDMLYESSVSGINVSNSVVTYYGYKDGRSFDDATLYETDIWGNYHESLYNTTSSSYTIDRVDISASGVVDVDGIKTYNYTVTTTTVNADGSSSSSVSSSGVLTFDFGTGLQVNSDSAGSRYIPLYAYGMNFVSSGVRWYERV